MAAEAMVEGVWAMAKEVGWVVAAMVVRVAEQYSLTD